jgi:hypothetical protein
LTDVLEELTLMMKTLSSSEASVSSRLHGTISQNSAILKKAMFLWHYMEAELFLT